MKLSVILEEYELDSKDFKLVRHSGKEFREIYQMGQKYFEAYQCEQGNPVFDNCKYILSFVATESLVLFTVNGDSMDSPTSQIKDGGLVLVDKSITEFKNDGIYVIALDDALYVKRLQILPGRKLKVKSDNLNYDPFEVSLDTDNFHIIGKVIWAGGLLECIK